MRIRDWDRNLKVRLFGESLMNITFWMFFPFMAIYFTEAFGKDRAGLLLIVSQVFGVFANLMGGYWADRYGRKRMMVLSSFGQGLAFLVFALVSSPWLQLPLVGFACFTVASMCGSVYWPASQAMVADVVEEKDRNSVFAVFYTSINVAVVLGPLLGAIFYVNYRFQLLFAAGLTCLLLGAVLWRWTRETAPALKGGEARRGKPWYIFLLRQFRDYVVIFRDKTFMLFIISGVLVAQIFMQLDLLIPVYMKEAVHEQTLLAVGDWSLVLSGERAFGVILSENGLLVVLLTIAVTKWVTRYKEKHVFLLSCTAYAVAMIIFSQTTLLWGLIAGMAVYTLGELTVAGIQQSFISKLAPEEMRGQYFAAASLRYTVGRTLAPIAIPLTERIGYESTFLLLAAVALVSAGVYYVMFQRFEKSEGRLMRAE